MRKKLFWLTMLICLASVFALSSCNLNDYTASGKNGATFTLNGELASEAVFGEELDLSSLSIVKTENGTSETIPVTKEMIISGNTSQVGLQTITFSYEGSTFTRTVNVKYRVVFKNGNDVVSTQYVTSASEIIPPAVESTDAYEFKSWTPGIEGELTGNVTYSANYSVKVPTPPTTLNATYGTKLSELTLPSNSAGAWVFDAAAGATVGNAGAANNEFNISFIVNGAVEKTAKVNINVAKKPLEFKNLVTEFIYNGSRQIPTFDFGSDVINPDNVLFFEDGRSDYTSVGEYTYDFFIDDPNYEGEATGTYVIKKADVSVDIESYVISVIDALPKIEYTVTGPVPEALLGIAVKADSYSSAGTYGITATTSNPNVNLTVTGGVLTVTVAYPNINDIGYPIISGGGSNFDLSIDRNREKGIDAVYEQTFEDYTFSYSAYGAWRWEKSGLIGDASETAYFCKIIFTHNNSLYEPLVMEIPVKVSKKVLEITVTSNEATYDGKEHGIEYSIFDADGKQYTNIKVENYATYVNAGSYNLNLYINEQNYTSIKYEETLTIKKSNTPPDADFEQTFSIVWSNALQLGDVILPERYAWVDETLDIDELGKFSFDAEYTPLDADNYNTVPGKITVEILPAKAEIFGAKESYTATYNGEAYAIKGLTANYNDPIFEISFTQNGDEVKPINAGVYDVIISLPAQGCYDAAAPISATLTISKANASFIGYESSYETEYNGDAFVISGITDTNTDIDVSFTYTKDGETVSEIKNAGTYTVTITLPESDNYNAASESVEVTVTVNKKTNTDTIPTYSTNSLGNAITFGDALSTITLPTSAYGSWTWETPDALVGNATTTGNTHKAIFTPYSQYEENYAAREADVTVIVAKKVIPTPAVPDANKSQTYTGGNLYVGIDNDTLYTVNEYTAIDVATYTVTITLTAEAQANYAWDSATNTIATTSVQFSITKAKAEITGLALNGWTYSPDNANANEPDADSSFGTPTFTYYKGAVKLDAKPTAAGTYIVKAIVAGTSNYDGDEETLEFTIAKADASITANGNYSFTYSGETFDITGVVGSHNEASVILSIESVTGAGTYTVKATLAETDNYNAAELEFEVFVDKAENTDSVTKAQSAYYQDPITKLSLPTNANGTWSWKDKANDATVGAAGTHTFIAKYTDTSGNYYDKEVEVTVTVEKAIVKVPTVEDKEYDGIEYIPTIPTDARYTVTENLGGTNMGEYRVILKLADSENFTWEDSDEESITLVYHIDAAVNKWATYPSISESWYYGEEPTVEAKAEFGGVKIEYAPYGTTDFTETLPEDAGTYTVKFTTTDTNYRTLEVTSKITIKPKEITVPTLDMTTIVYTGKVINPAVVDKEESIYTITYVNSIDVGSYNVTLSLKNTNNYVWTIGGTDDVSLPYSISKADAGLTASITGWTYTPDNSGAKEPSYTSLFTVSGVEFLYAGADGVYSSTVPSTAGTYTVKAVYSAVSDNNIKASESLPVTFVIAKADASFSGYLDEYETEYNGSKYEISGITDTNTDIDVSFTYTKDGETVSEIKNAGTYTVTITLEESDNYNAAPESVEVTVTVNKKANTDTIPTYSTNSLGNAITFGDALSTISLPTSTYGTWAWNNPTDLVGNATTVGNTHKATFTPYSQYEENYAAREADVTVIVAKKVISTPAVPDANKSQTYTGGNLYVGIDNDTLYTVDDYTAIDVNTYTVYITLTAEAQNNYVWETPIESDTTKTSVQFSITKATNAWTKSPAISKSEWDYGDSSIVFSAEAKCGTVSIKYTSDGGVTYSADVPTSVGTHTAVFYVAETDNYFGLSEVAVNFTINVGQAVITNFKAPGWAYMDFASTPVTAETNVGTVTFIYYDEAGNELADRPVNVGKYKVKAHVADDANGNYLGTTTTAIEFNIKKATPTLNEACYANESVTYQTSVSTSTSKLAATYQGADMAEAITLTGTFKFSSVTFVESTEENPSASYIKLTFTPTEDYADRFSTVTVTINMALKTLARVKNTDKDVPYGTIENALNAATAGDTVWVNPGTSSSIKITKSVTVKAGVTLMLPYGSAETDVNTSFTATGTSKTHSVTVKTKITVSSSVTITNYGTIQISGVISGSGGNAKYAGHTRGNCAQIVLGKNAKIVSKSGSVIKCFGYITESAANNGSSVTIEDGAQLYQPFVLRDFRGGGYMSGVYYKLSDGFTPFNMYQFINVMPTVRVNYGGELIGIVNLRANSKQNQELVTIVGYNSSAIIQLTDSAYSYLTSKTTVENAPSDATTSNILNPKYDYNNYKVTRVNIYGGAQTNPMHIELSVELIGNISLDTASTFFPVPYFYQISLLNNTKAGQTDAEFYMEQKFKFMTGSSLTIGEGVTLKASQLIFYEEFIDECTLSNTIYPEKPAAILNLYGTLICDTLGATVNIKSENARIIITKATSCVGKEVIESDNMYLSKSKSFTVYTFLVYDVSGQSIELSGPVGYYVANGELTVMTISFISDGGIEIPAVNVTSEVYPTLSNPTRTGYVFVGWYYGDTLVQKGDALQLIASHTLEARWRKLTIVEFNSDGGSTHDSVYADGTYNTLPTPTKEGYDFLGWYYGDTLVQNGDAVVSAEDHTLTAKWRKVISVTLDFDNGNSSSTILIDAESDTPIYSNLPTPTKTNHTFLGWYRGDVLVSSGDALSDLENHTLVARWRAHTVITLNADGGTVSLDTLYVDAVDDGKYPSLPTPEKEGYSFTGWYCNEVPINAGDSLVSSDVHILIAGWKQLVPITLNANGGTVSSSTVYFDSDGPLVYPTLPTPTKEGHKFLGWYYEGQKVEAGNNLLNEVEHSLVAEWEVISYTITLGEMSNASVTVTVNGQQISSGASVPYGTTVSVSVTYNKNSSKTLTIKNNATNKNIYSGNKTSYEFVMPAGNVTISASSEDSCVTSDTLVTLADGTQVRIDSLTGNELLLVWNFYTGTYDVAPAITMNHGYSKVNVLTLVFSDGTTVNTINGHGFFDSVTKQFVVIDEENVSEYVGHNFVKQNGESYSTTELIGYTLENRYTEVWSILTIEHFNCVLEGMWTITRFEIDKNPTFLMPYEINNEMKFDELLMQQDIEKYGLATYEEFAEYCSYEHFVLFKLESAKVAIGKGYITLEELLMLISIHPR